MDDLARRVITQTEPLLAEVNTRLAASAGNLGDKILLRTLRDQLDGLAATAGAVLEMRADPNPEETT